MNGESVWSDFSEIGPEQVQNERPMKSVREIVVQGAVDVFFRRHDVPQLVVAGDSQQAVDAIKTTFRGDKLVIDTEGFSVQYGGACGGSVSVSGHVGGSVIVGSQNVVVSGNVAGVHINIQGQNIHVTSGSGGGRAVVGIALPDIPAVGINGSGNVTLLDLKQAALELCIKGSGDITARGHVDALTAWVEGSGDVDVSDLVASRGDLSIAGSGDIEAYVVDAVTARVAGSGDIVVRGNTRERSKHVVGSGSVRFK